MNLIKRIQIWFMRHSLQHWQEREQAMTEAAEQCKARAEHVAKQIEELEGERV